MRSPRDSKDSSVRLSDIVTQARDYLVRKNEVWCLEKWPVLILGFASIIGIRQYMARGIDINKLQEESERFIQERYHHPKLEALTREDLIIPPDEKKQYQQPEPKQRTDVTYNTK